MDRVTSEYKIFLSYGRKDGGEIADRLRSDLHKLGYNVWFDAEEIRVGKDWQLAIESALLQADAVLFVMTPHAVRRPDGVCHDEISYARSKVKRLIPIKAAPCQSPFCIHRLHYLEYKPPQEAGAYERMLRQIIEQLTAAESSQTEGQKTYLINTLSDIDFSAEIAEYSHRFQGRDWLFQKVRSWLDDPTASNFFYLKGGAGTGKSAIASRMSRIFPEVMAVHLCQFGDSIKSSPLECVCSLAYQLSCQWPDYESCLLDLTLEEIKKGNQQADVSSLPFEWEKIKTSSNPAQTAQTAFDRLIVQPLNRLSKPGHPVLCVIDALDEAFEKGVPVLADLLLANAKRLPPWLRFFITSRPNERFNTQFSGFSSLTLDKETNDNLNDIREYLCSMLPGISPRALATATEKSQGIFLYAQKLVEEIERKTINVEKPEHFPEGLSGLYLRWFDRVFLARQDEYDRLHRPIFQLMATAREPLTKEMISDILGMDTTETSRALGPLTGFLNPTTDKIIPFHKSLLDWLSGFSLTHDDEEASQSSSSPPATSAYHIDVATGHRSFVHWAAGMEETSWPERPAYLARHLFSHLRSLNMDTQAAELLCDYWYIEAKRHADGVIQLPQEYRKALESYPEFQDEQRNLWSLNRYLMECATVEARWTASCRIGTQTPKSWDWPQLPVATEGDIPQAPHTEDLRAWFNVVNTNITRIADKNQPLWQTLYNAVNGGPVSRAVETVLPAVSGAAWFRRLQRLPYTPGRQALLASISPFDFSHRHKVEGDTFSKSAHISLIEFYPTSIGLCLYVHASNGENVLWNLHDYSLHFLDVDEAINLGERSFPDTPVDSDAAANLGAKSSPGLSLSPHKCAYNPDKHCAVLYDRDYKTSFSVVLDDDFTNPRPIAVRRGVRGAVEAFLRSSNGDVALVSADSPIMSGRLLTRTPENATWFFSEDGRYAVSKYVAQRELFAQNSKVRIISFWNMELGVLVQTETIADPYMSVSCLSPDGQLFADASPSGYIRIWNFLRGTSPGRDQEAEATSLPPEHNQALLYTEKTATLVDRAQRKRIRDIETETSVDLVAFTPDRKHIVTGESSGRLSLKSITDGREIWSANFGEGGFHCLHISPDGQWALVGSGAQHNEMALCNLDDGSLLWRETIDDWLSTAVSANCQSLAVSTSRGCFFFDLRRRTLRHVASLAINLDISPSGKTVVLHMPELLLWCPETQKEPVGIPGGSPGYVVQMSALDDTTLLITTQDRIIYRKWNGDDVRDVVYSVDADILQSLQQDGRFLFPASRGGMQPSFWLEGALHDTVSPVFLRRYDSPCRFEDLAIWQCPRCLMQNTTPEEGTQATCSYCLSIFNLTPALPAGKTFQELPNLLRRLTSALDSPLPLTITVETELHYDIFETDDDDILMAIRARKASPINPMIFYDGVAHALYVRRQDQLIILDYIHPEVRENLARNMEVLFAEFDNGEITREYLAPVFIRKLLHKAASALFNAFNEQDTEEEQAKPPPEEDLGAFRAEALTKEAEELVNVAAEKSGPERMDVFKQAEELYLEALDLRGDDAAALEGLGILYNFMADAEDEIQERARRHAQAVAFLHSARQRRVSVDIAWFSSNSLLALGNLTSNTEERVVLIEHAIRILGQGLSEFPNHAGAMYNLLTEAYLALSGSAPGLDGKKTWVRKARQQCILGLKADKENSECLGLFAYCQQRLAEWESSASLQNKLLRQAERMLERAAKQEPNKAGARIARIRTLQGLIHARQGDHATAATLWNTAENLLAHALKIRPERTYLGQACLAAAMGNAPQCQAALAELSNSGGISVYEIADEPLLQDILQEDWGKDILSEMWTSLLPGPVISSELLSQELPAQPESDEETVGDGAEEDPIKAMVDFFVTSFSDEEFLKNNVRLGEGCSFVTIDEDSLCFHIGKKGVQENIDSAVYYGAEQTLFHTSNDEFLLCPDIQPGLMDLLHQRKNVYVSGPTEPVLKKIHVYLLEFPSQLQGAIKQAVVIKRGEQLPP